MKLIILSLLAILTFLLSCNQPNVKAVEDANQNLTEAKSGLKDAEVKEIEALKERDEAEWNNFKNQADSSITTLENDLKKLEIRINAADKKDKEKLKANYNKAKSDLEILKEKLYKRNIEFENDIKSFNKNVSEKNQSFKQEFKHDMDAFGKSFKDLFKDNIK